ncbi:MAG: hypothetical protein QMB94_09035, partial [Phycisphaerales bacterium]
AVIDEAGRSLSIEEIHATASDHVPSLHRRSHDSSALLGGWRVAANVSVPSVAVEFESALFTVE